MALIKLVRCFTVLFFTNSCLKPYSFHWVSSSGPDTEELEAGFCDSFGSDHFLPRFISFGCPSISSITPPSRDFVPSRIEKIDRSNYQPRTQDTLSPLIPGCTLIPECTVWGTQPNKPHKTFKSNEYVVCQLDHRTGWKPSTPITVANFLAGGGDDMLVGCQ